MHHLSLVVISSAPLSGEIPAGEVDAMVVTAMEPYHYENRETGFWDWYQVGGRWTGVYSGYDPEADPANADPLFGGVAWPTRWVRHAGDILTPGQVLAALEGGKQTPHTMVTPEWVGHSGTWEASGFVPTPDWDTIVRTKVANMAAFGDRFRLVVVDYHS